jgi:hypothetical protein
LNVSAITRNSKLLAVFMKEFEMFSKISIVAAGAMFLLGAAPLSGIGTAAFAMAPLQGASAGQTGMSGDGMMQLAQSMERGKVARQGDRRLRSSWNRGRDGQRCSRRYGNCRHYYRGSYYETPWWTLPLIVGGGIIAGQRYNSGGYGSRHVAWCSDKYRSYNRRNNTWIAYGGQVRQCDSPYG